MVCAGIQGRIPARYIEDVELYQWKRGELSQKLRCVPKSVENKSCDFILISRVPVDAGNGICPAHISICLARIADIENLIAIRQNLQPIGVAGVISMDRISRGVWLMAR